jgi:hypothetical protein
MASESYDSYIETKVLSKHLLIPGLVQLVKNYTKFQCMGLQCAKIGTCRTTYIEGIEDKHMTIHRTVFCKICYREWLISKRGNSPYCSITCNQGINIEYMRFFNVEKINTTPLTY